LKEVLKKAALRERRKADLRDREKPSSPLTLFGEIVP